MHSRHFLLAHKTHNRQNRAIRRKDDVLGMMKKINFNCAKFL